jgi:hypothetical protein
MRQRCACSFAVFGIYQGMLPVGPMLTDITYSTITCQYQQACNRNTTLISNWRNSGHKHLLVKWYYVLWNQDTPASELQIMWWYYHSKPLRPNSLRRCTPMVRNKYHSTCTDSIILLQKCSSPCCRQNSGPTEFHVIGDAQTPCIEARLMTMWYASLWTTAEKI